LHWVSLANNQGHEVSDEPYISEFIRIVWNPMEFRNGRKFFKPNPIRRIQELPAKMQRQCLVVVAYDIYLELLESKLDDTWKLVDAKGKPNPIDFHVFRETLARQMLAYDQKKCKYMGDEKFRDSTKQPKQGTEGQEASSSSSSACRRWYTHSSYQCWSYCWILHCFS
jgi:hypothetical protein